MSLGGIVDAILGKDDRPKVKGRVILMKKNVLDFINIGASVVDGISDLLGQKVSIQLISGSVNYADGLEGKLSNPAYLESWLTDITPITAGESTFSVTFDWDRDEFGVPGAFIIKNLHLNEFFLKSLTLEDVPNYGKIHFVCNSWVYPAFRYKSDRIFFANQAYLPSETPQPLRKYRENELVALRGDGTGKLEEWDRVYDYACYNDLGEPDKGEEYARPILGGSSEYPYPRRGRTGREPTKADPNCESRNPLPMSLDIYVPRDERFGHVKKSDFLTSSLKSSLQTLLPAFKALCDNTPNEFNSFADVLNLYEGGIKLPEGPWLKAITDNISSEILKDILQTDGQGLLKYPTPQVIQGDKTAWRTDEEFGREMLAGSNPVLISRLQEFPPKSKLDPTIYGNQNSTITTEHVQDKLNGLTVNEAIKSNRLFILNHHDIVMPLLRKINMSANTKAYASRTLLFLQDDRTLKPLAIELSLPHPDGDQFGTVSKVYTPADQGVEGSIWQFAKAYVAVNDMGIHQLISHWLNTHAVIEPFVIATNRHLSVLHPIHKLLHPHFRNTMNINALARETLTYDGGFETSLFPAKYSMEMSAAAYKDWVFPEQALPADLLKRGVAVEDLSSPHGIRLLILDYPYAVDGLEIWAAIKSWVTEYCKFYYKSDETVEKDTELQAWWKELREEGHGDKKDEISINCTCRTIALKLAENVNHHGTPAGAADSGGLSTTPSKASLLRTVRTAAVSPIAIQNDCLVDVHISCQEPAINMAAESLSQTTTSSNPSSGHVAEEDSDYAPRSRAAVSSTAQSPISFDYDATPADTVKKRRRTASWKIGANGPTIVVTDNDSKEKSRKKKSRSSTGVMVGNDMEDEDGVELPDNFDSSSPITLRDEDLPEKLVATWKEGITGVDQDFKSVKEFRAALQKYAVAHRFVYKLKKNDATRVSGRCVVEGCSWKIHASRVPDAQTFRIRKYNDLHTCEGKSWKSSHRTRNWLVSIIKERLRDSPNDKPREIAKSILRDFGIKLRYSQVWRGMEDAKEQLQGSYSKSYNRLSWFCEKVVNTNPGTVVKLVLDDEKRLQRFFFSLHASIHGFKHGCRPLIFLEATSLRSKYKETLITATAVDADDCFFPVAFAVIDIENDDSWRWFLEQLKSALSTSHSITFISDREKNLKNSVFEVFENSSHGYSIFHLLESFKRNMKGPFHGDGRAVLPEIFLAAAHAVRLNGFKSLTEQIKQICSHAYDWLNQIEPECWTSLSFKGQHYNYITENVAEPYSKLIEDSRGSTIMQKIEALICMLSDLIDHRKLESSTWSTKLTPSKEKKMQKEAAKAHGLKVLISSDVLFEVHDEMTHVVNIENRECTCFEWKQSGLPCCHAVAVFNSIGKSVYDYCSSYFTVESYHFTYSASVNPIPGIGTADEEDGESDTADVLPPCPPELPIEEKPEQTKTMDPDKRTVTCSKCKEPGHNKASCKATL